MEILGWDFECWGSDSELDQDCHGTGEAIREPY